MAKRIEIIIEHIISKNVQLYFAHIYIHCYEQITGTFCM